MKRIHTDLVCPIVGFFLLAGTTICLFCSNTVRGFKLSENSVVDLAEGIAVEAAVFGLVSTAWNLHSQTHQHQREKASAFIQEWRSSDIQKPLDTLLNAKRQLDSAQDLKSESVVVCQDIGKHEEITTVLGLFEQMGQDVKFKVSDENYLKNYFFRIVTEFYSSFQFFIAEGRKTKGDGYFCNFEYLAKKWKVEGPPSLP
jgi:hypothetical protein